MQRLTILAFLAVTMLLAAPARLVAQEDLPARLAPLNDWRRTELFAVADAALAKDCVSVARRALADAKRLDGETNAVEERLSALGDRDDGPKVSEKTRASLAAKLGKHHVAAAKKLSVLAKWCAGNELPAEGKGLATEALGLDRECTAAHAVLSHKKVKGWGWVPKEDAARLKKGLLPVGGKWITKAARKKLSGWESAVVTESAHFRITSDLELGRLFALKDSLDILHDRWMADWAGFLPLKAFDGRHDVLVFATKADYASYIEANDPAHIKGVPGQYSPNLKKAMFYDVEVMRATGQQISSLQELTLHECTHQLFRELVDGKPNNTEAGNSANYWAHEGIASYYEMHTPSKKGLVLERKFVSGMLRTRHLKDHAGSMLDMGQTDTVLRDAFLSQEMTRRQTNYAQAGFVCAFFMGRAHRSGFRRVIREVYCGDNRTGLIREFISEDLAALEREFQAFFKKF